MTEPLWIDKRLAIIVHSEQLREHGGAHGIRDEGALEAALDRPRNLFAYEQADLIRLGASYAHGIVRNHPFVDGNKRTSLVLCLTFLALNGIEIEATDIEKYETWIDLTNDKIREPGLARWLKAHHVPPSFTFHNSDVP